MVDEWVHICLHVFFLKETGDSNMILLNDGWLLTYLVNKGHKKIHWAK